MNIKPYVGFFLIQLAKMYSFNQKRNLVQYRSYKKVFSSILPAGERYIKMKKTEYYENEEEKKLSQKSVFQVYQPKTENQQKYLDLLNNKNNSLIVVVGSAGTGKTMYACLKAIELLKSKKVKKVIITRPVVSVEEDIGFLPGNIESKMDPFMRPIFDIFTEVYSAKEIQDLITMGLIEISPLAYMRGRTFKNAFIIADEMQNSSPNQMLMLLTRIGENSRMVLTGDLSQSDKSEENGLKDFMEKWEKYPIHMQNETGIQFVYFNNTDIQRNILVKNILDIYQSTEKKVVKKQNSKNHKKVLLEEKTNETITSVKKEEIVNSCDDAALIPKQHTTYHFKDWGVELGK
jgi:phosphate starvation-inducible PhoH-like protein